MAPRMLQCQTDANEAAYPPDGDVCIFMSPDKENIVHAPGSSIRRDTPRKSPKP